MNNFSQEQLKKIKSVLKSQKFEIDITDKGNLNKTLNDFGIDSLAALGIIVNLEEAFNVHLDDEKIAKIKTIGDLLNLLSEELNNK